MLKCLVTVWKTGKKLQVQLSILPATTLPPPPTPQIVSPEDLKTTTSTITEYIIGHFRETKTLTFKTRLSAKTIFCV